MMSRASRRRDLMMAGLSGLALGSLPALAATPSGSSRPFRIFMILHRGETEVERGFKAYFEHRKIPLELTIRDIAQDPTKVPGFVAEAKAMKPDLIYSWGTPVTLGVVGKLDAIDPARHVTDIPVVFTMVANPLGAKLVAQRTSSGRNITGASHVVPLDQQLAAIRAYRPLKDLGVLFNPGEPSSVQVVKDLREAARRDRFILKEFAVPLDAQKKPLESALPQLIAQIARARPQFLYLGPDSFIGAQRKVITETALAQGLSTFAATEVMLRDGRALFGLVSGYENLGRLTAYKAEQILVQKKRPQDIPIETLARFSYIVNMSVATQLDAHPPLKVVNFAEIIR
ncbi:ABC transporter substrate-binding protein [Lacisediminimonas sp.]|uniref:ABC transporter substrate-binding protein n=1 Tax=Lacisediminimonas sp. TaxID=3060582 RepID=UPI00271BC9E6|nr:ABC transporter substrate-binding protein [Lacisediminimonas sp.]MDO8300708.1 ABC transporter substrate-binding protein [Lacisediminimonas sp.]